MVGFMDGIARTLFTATRRALQLRQVADGRKISPERPRNFSKCSFSDEEGGPVESQASDHSPRGCGSSEANQWGVTARPCR